MTRRELTDFCLTFPAAYDIDYIGCLPDLLQLAPSAQVIANVEEAPTSTANAWLRVMTVFSIDAS